MGDHRTAHHAAAAAAAAAAMFEAAAALSGGALSDRALGSYEALLALDAGNAPTQAQQRMAAALRHPAARRKVLVPVVWRGAADGGDDGGAEECAVCLDAFRRRSRVARLPCGHHFHDHCIAEWLRKDHRCPLCRRDVAPPP